MKLDHELRRGHNTRQMAFTADYYRLLGGARKAAPDIAMATRQEVYQAFALINEGLALADRSTVEMIWRHDPSCFRVIRHGPDLRNASMMAYLPLNSYGLAAIIDGRFDGRQPDIAAISRPGEHPEAMYLWLIYAPQRLRDCLQLIDHLAHTGNGVPIFSRPVSSSSKHILSKIGFMPGRSLFPDAAPWLQCLLPLERSDREVDIQPVSSIDMLFKVFSVRSATYIAEQSAPFDEEFDGNDFCATHLLGTVNGDAAGCARIRYFGNFAKFERFAVRREYRGTVLLPRLARACISHARAKGFRLAYAHARSDLVPLWQRYGARLVEDRPSFRFSGIDFREMVMDIDCPSPISLEDGPLRAIRPEGKWSTVGPLDRSLLQRPPSVPAAAIHP